MRSPVGPRGLEVFCQTGSNKNNVKGVIFLQGLIACINPNWGPLPVRVELLGSSPYQGGKVVCRNYLGVYEIPLFTYCS